MTYREKIAQEHPEAIGDVYVAGVCGCPVSWGYGDKKDYKCFDESYYPVTVPPEVCEACWDREIREEEKCCRPNEE